MSESEGSGTITPELKIKELEESLAQETERLLKVYDAFEQQEKEIVNLRAEIEVLEKEIVEREIEKESLESLLSEKDNRLREIEMKGAKASKQVDFLEPELQKMEEKFTREKDRLGKVFGIAEELDGDLKLAVSELNARDNWYVDHMALFEDLNKAIKLRYEMIETAVESQRKSQHMSRAIQERMDEAIEARAAEAVEDNVKADDAENLASGIEVAEDESSSTEEE